MGFLEKKKDYKKRALDHQRKEAKMKSLRKKAKERNPDEFYFKMVNTHLDDGEHVEEEKPPGDLVDTDDISSITPSQADGNDILSYSLSYRFLSTLFSLSEYSEEQLKIMTIQDERYLNYKRQIERKKIEKLKSSLHLIDAETGAQRKHTFFVDKKVICQKTHSVWRYDAFDLTHLIVYVIGKLCIFTSFHNFSTGEKL